MVLDAPPSGARIPDGFRYSSRVGEFARSIRSGLLRCEGLGFVPAPSGWVDLALALKLRDKFESDAPPEEYCSLMAMWPRELGRQLAQAGVERLPLALASCRLAALTFLELFKARVKLD